MSKLTVAQNALSTLAQFSGDDLLNQIQEWNKTKTYPATPVSITIDANGVKDNAEEIGKIVDTIGEYVDDVVANTLDADGVANTKAVVSAIGTWLTETRKIQTNPLKEVAGHFTKHEARFKEYTQKLQEAIERINEREYQAREKVIRAYFTEILQADGMDEVVSMDTFADFIEKKRKTNCLTSKGALNKATKDAIDKAVLDVTQPIRDARALEERKALQSKQFGSYLDNVETSGDTVVLEASIVTLNRYKEQVPGLYPDIEAEAMRRINEKIELCKANIRANEAEAKRKEQEDVDKDILHKLGWYEDSMLSEVIGTLLVWVEDLRTAYREAKLSTTQDEIKRVADLLNARIEELAPKPETSQPKAEEPTEAPEPSETVWSISKEDVEVLLLTTVTATTEEEAKQKFVEVFREHLEMVDLNKGEAE